MTWADCMKTLAEWVRDPKATEEDDVIPPTLVACLTAAAAIGRVGETIDGAVDRIVPDRDGGIGITVRGDENWFEYHIHHDGDTESWVSTHGKVEDAEHVWERWEDNP